MASTWITDTAACSKTQKNDMSRSRPVSRADLNQLVMDQPEAEGTMSRNNSPHTPLIHISHPNMPLTESWGIDNPVFTFENIEFPAHTRSTTPTDWSQGPVSLSRRGSYAGPKGDSSSRLTVPETGGRRNSLGSVSTSGNESLAVRRGLVPMQTLNIDTLYTSQSLTPLSSPGGRSMRSNWSELVRLGRKDSLNSVVSETGSTKSMSGVSTAMSERMRELVRKFSSRTEYFKEKTIQPPTPSTVSLDAKSAISGMSGNELEPPGRQHRLDSFIPLSSRASGSDSQNEKYEKYISIGRCRIKLPRFMQKLRTGTIDPQNKLYLFWLFIVAMAFVYNFLAFTLRAAFREADKYINQSNHSMGLEKVPGYETNDNRIYWWICDYTCDLLYLLDILLVKNRIQFVHNGMLEEDLKETFKNYKQKLAFKMDILCLTPLDLLYLIPAVRYNSLLRFPRILKIQTFWEFYDRMDQASRAAHWIRIGRTMTYMMFLIHLETCGYYAVSVMEKLNYNEWVYDGNKSGVAYIRCMYLATKTATSIGNNPKPTNELEYLFMTVYWLSGVFVFALLIGQIRDIIQSASTAQTHYRKTMDQTLAYMQSMNLPNELQDKVRMWFNYNWEHQKTLNENSLLEALPRKMKTDLAINVHFQTLSKVALFQNCDKNLLFDLVLKLQPVLVLPGDYICRKGEVGTEMYIVMQGQVEVVGGENNSIVFATLHEGSVFGEISLLALAGGNRRTADVRSKGYTNIFTLSKADFEEAMTDYPDAAAMLKKRAKKLLAQNAKHEKKEQKMEVEEVIKSRHGTPKLLKTVVQVLDSDSHIPEYLGMSKEKSIVTKEGHGDKVQCIKDVKDSLDDLDPMLYEEDEILVIEQIEQPVPPKMHIEDDSLTDSGRASENSVREANNESPGLASIGVKAHGKGSRSATPTKLLLDRNNKVTPTDSRPSSATSESSLRRRNLPRVRSNKVDAAPMPLETRTEVRQPPALVHVPPENQVTCLVDVHREKSRTPSLVSESSPRDGVDNPAYMHGDPAADKNKLQVQLQGKASNGHNETSL